MKTNRERFLAKHNLSADTSLSIDDVARLSGMPVAALKQVYRRGLGAYYTNPESVRVQGTFKKDPDAPLSTKLSAPQWAMARLYAFVMKTDKVFYGADKDIKDEYDL